MDVITSSLTNELSSIKTGKTKDFSLDDFSQYLEEKKSPPCINYPEYNEDDHHSEEELIYSSASNVGFFADYTPYSPQYKIMKNSEYLSSESEDNISNKDYALEQQDSTQGELGGKFINAEFIAEKDLLSKSNNDHNNLSDQFLAEIKKSLNKEESPYFEKENQLRKLLAKQDDESKLTLMRLNDEINETESEKDIFETNESAFEKDPYHFSEQLKLEEQTSLPKEPNKIVQQFSDHIIKNIKRNNNFISFTLEPKELGKIGIKMDFEHKNILITTDQQGVQEMLQENLNMLSSNLNDSGMGNMNFNFEQKENTTNQESLESELPPPENSDCLLDILV